jgi:hypothetical protein
MAQALLYPPLLIVLRVCGLLWQLLDKSCLVVSAPLLRTYTYDQ